LSWVCLVLEAFSSPSDDAVEHHSLLRVTVSWTDAGLYRALVVLLDSLFEPVEILAGAGSGEVVAVHRH
jgi:hypothetical protein